MRITWEDRKHRGQIDNYALQEKPQFSFEYAWFLVTDTTAQYVESHEYGYWNEDMTDEQRQEVVDFYNSWEAPKPAPIVEPEPTLADLVRRKRNEIDSARKQTEVQGFRYTFPDGVTGTIQLRNSEDKANITGLVLAAQTNRSGILGFRDGEDQTHIMTSDDIIAMGAATQMFISELYQVAWMLKDQLSAVTTAAELESLVWPYEIQPEESQFE